MSSTRTISLLIALAFLPLAGFATAQPDPNTTEPCEDRSGTAIRDGDNQLLCAPPAPGPSVEPGCDGDVAGASIRDHGNQLLCVPQLASLTVGFHTDGPDGPGVACDGDSNNHITATIPPSPTPDFAIDERIAGTGCIQVTSDEGSAAVGIPAPVLPDAVVTITFYDGNFVPGPAPITTGTCLGTPSVALTLGAAGPVPGTPPGEGVQCVEATVSLDGETVLRVAAGVPAGLPAPTVPPCDPTTAPDACQALVCALLPDPAVCEQDLLPPQCDPTNETTFDPVTCADLPGLEAGTLGYHAHFTFLPPLAVAQEPAFQFSGNAVAITAELYNSTGPTAFEAPGAFSCRANFVLSRFPPAADGADADPLPDLQISRCADSYSAGFTRATLTVARDVLVTASDEPGTVWTIRVESPNTPIVAAEGTEMVPFPSAFSFYSAAANATFDAENTALADVLDAVPTPIRALPKPFATIVAVKDTVTEDADAETEYGTFNVTVAPSPNAPSGWTDVNFTVATGAGHAEASDYKLWHKVGATWTELSGTTIRVPGSQRSADSAIVQVRPSNDALLEYDEAVTLSIAETKDAAVDPESELSATVTLVDNEKPWVRILAANSTLTAKEAGPAAASIVFERQSPDAGEPNALLPAFELRFSRVAATDEVTLADFAAPPCTSPINTPPAGCVDVPVPSCPAPTAGTPVADVCAAVAEALSAPASGVQCGATLEAECTLAFAANSNRTVVSLMPADDAEIEMEEEEFAVNVLDSDAYDLAASGVSATVTLLDNEARPTINLVLNGAATAEAGNPLRLTVLRTALTTVETRVPITIAGEGSLDSDFVVRDLAGQDVDFEAIDGGINVVIPVDASEVSLAITGLQDTLAEGDESVSLSLEEGLFTKGARKLVRFTIGDDDPLPLVTVRAIDNEAGEADTDPASFLVERFGSLTGDLVVNLEQVAGGAQEGQDYALSANQVTLAGGVTSAVVTLTPIDDDVAEAPEGVALALVDDGTFLLADPSVAGVRISDDDIVAVHVSVPDADLSEQDATTGVMRIHRTPVGLDKALTVGYTVRGSATSGQDFVALPGSATIPAGESFVDVTVKAVDDALADANEQIDLELRASTLYVRELRIAATLTILDNDLPPAGDLDGDGLSNADDICPNHADPEPADLDADGKGDACDDDQDGDGATDVAELAAGTDARDADTDRDLVPDGKEVLDGSDPLDAFSPDYRAKDVEAFLEDDGMHVTWTASDPRVGRFLVWRLSEPELVAEIDAGNGTEYEIVDGDFPGGRHTYRVQAVLDGQTAVGYEAGSSGASAPVFASLCTAQPLDSDGDDLCDARELELGTDPDVADSDGDGLGDGAETLGRYGDASDPLEVDTDGDGTDDGDEVDLESVSSDPAGADLDAAWIGIAAVLAGVVLVLSLVGVVRFMRRS